MAFEQLRGLIARVIWPIVVIYLLTRAGKFLWRGYCIRRRFRNLPGPPGHSWLWGHLPAMGEISQEMPYESLGNMFPLLMKEKYGTKQNFIYVDVWPISDPLLLVHDAEIEQQLTVDQDTAKHNAMRDILTYISGPGEIVGANGQQWKKWRTALNPGFSAAHLMTHVPIMVDETARFVKCLGNYAKSGKVFRLEEEAVCLTLDIIGLVIAGLKLDTQGEGRNGAFARALRHQATIIPVKTISMWKKINPVFIYQRWRNLKIMRAVVGQKVDEQLQNRHFQMKTQSKRGGTVIEMAQRGGIPENNDFREMTITQTMSFIFGGQDSTASTICYALYELARNPACLARLREEHDNILGSTEHTPEILKSDPYILNRLPYTAMVIHETLRLWSPVGSARQGRKDLYIRDPVTGESYPTEDCLISLAVTALHRNPDIWGADATKFDPSRFEDESKLPPHAYRPFEKGPRHCIGQPLALLELKVVLALVVRLFDFIAAFDRLDELEDDGTFWSQDKNWRKGKQDIQGEVAYQSLLVTLKPREGMPMVVKRRAEQD